MRRLMLVFALVALSGCATVYDDRYGYYRGHGDHYYDDYARSYVGLSIGHGGYGYSAYDSLFWGLQYSYFDPFWYPHFYYGVTYFPRYYGWSYWYARDYWRWRYFHPYSPYYGSYWDHYYAWHRWPGQGGRYGHGHGHGDPTRYGSARNVAERMARSSGDARGDHARGFWTDSSGHRDPARANAAVRNDYRRAPARSSRTWLDDSGLPSSRYVPETRRAARPFERGNTVRSEAYRRSGHADDRIDSEIMGDRMRASWNRQHPDSVDRGRSGPPDPGMFVSPPREQGRVIRHSAPRNPVQPAPNTPARPAGRSDRPMSGPSPSSNPGRGLGGNSRSRRER